MNPLLLSGFGISVNVDKRRLVINNKTKNEKREFYPHKIDYDNIVIDGHYGNVSFEALRWLSKHDISLTLLNWNGKLLSVALPENPKTGKLRICQYQKYLDGNFRFKIATEILKSKIKNSINLLKELSRFYTINIESFKKSLNDEEIYYQNLLNDFKSSDFKADSFKKDYLKNEFKNSDLKNDLSFKNSTNSLKLLQILLTYEGRIATLYWSELEKVFKVLKPEFNFKNRKNKSYSRNYNASDEINALLNYGYSILESQIRKAINSVGLDPTIGFLHEITTSRTPLVYDIQELFRWIVDLSVIQLLEDGKLKKSDFIITENYHTRLREDTAKLLIDKIRLNFSLKIPYKSGKNYYYSIILEDNIKQLANHVLGKSKNFEFQIPEIQLRRNDILELKEKIVSMTPEERKILGINKSTLWYIKKNLKNGKSIKFYDKILFKLDKDNI